MDFITVALSGSALVAHPDTSVLVRILLYITLVALSFDVGSFIIKSIVIELYSLYTIGRGCNSLYSLYYPVLLRL